MIRLDSASDRQPRAASRSETSAAQLALRSTALHVALVRRRAMLPAIHDWHARCMALIVDLDHQLEDRRYPDNIRRRISATHCALLDAVTQQYLANDSDRREWEADCLLARFHPGMEAQALMIAPAFSKVEVEFRLLFAEMGWPRGAASRIAGSAAQGAALSASSGGHNRVSMQPRTSLLHRLRHPLWAAATVFIVWFVVTQSLPHVAAKDVEASHTDVPRQSAEQSP